MFQRFFEYAAARGMDKNKIDKVGQYRIYTVNVTAVKEKHPAYRKFGELAIHFDYPNLVGENEVWIDDKLPEEKRCELMCNGVWQYDYKERGYKDYQKWADKRTKWEQEKKRGSKEGPHKMPMYNSPPDSIYEEYYCGLPTPNDDVEVWLVNGDKIRRKYCKSFVESGNGETYKWIPRQEIWIEKGMRDIDIPASVLHEYMEGSLVKKEKMPYEKAHLVALRAEQHQRKRKFEKPDVQALDRDEVIKLSKEYLKTI